MTDSEKRIRAAYTRLSSHYISWVHNPNALFLMLENQQIMAGWIGGKPLGALND